MIRYQFYNANPYNEIEGDCVCRAISTGLNVPYGTIERQLELVSELYECDKLSVCCYRHLIEDVYGLTPRKANGLTVGEVAEKYNAIIRIDGHLTCSIDGIVYDIWDCTKEIADLFWVCH